MSPRVESRTERTERPGSRSRVVVAGLTTLVAVLMLCYPRTGWTTCNPSCDTMNIDTVCLTQHYSCTEDTSTCALELNVRAAAGTICETDNNPCTLDACGSLGPKGDGICHHAPVADGTSCGALRTCAAGVCACSAGYKACGAECIPTTNCCVDTDCPSDASGHRHGVCTSGACTVACDVGYRECGGACIPLSQCCGSSGCTTPPNGCYKPLGTCQAGSCSYAYDDGASCDADGSACTPNDKCVSGSCLADVAHQVRCIQRPCHTAPSCNMTTGNCDDAVVGGACGGDGCTPPGSCSGGVCSSASKDCSAASGPCKVGICDPVIVGDDNCTSTNVLNGTACASADRCLMQTMCSGGACVGTRKACIPSGPCRVAICDGASGDCAETVAEVGAACASTQECIQDATCDAKGDCSSGVALPDGSPCVAAGCAVASTCGGGQCICRNDLDMSATPDGSSPGTADEAGCSMGGSPSSRIALALLCLLALALLRRRI